MSVLEAISPLGTAGTKPNQFSEMSSEDFLKVIFAELTNQDPLKPSDSGALLQQLSTIRSIESDLKLMQNIDQLVHGNQFAAAGNLIGKFIGGMTQDNISVAGWVVAILKQGNSIYLELDTGWLVPIQNVTTVIDPSLLPDDPNAPGNPNDPNDPGDPGDPNDPGPVGDDDLYSPDYEPDVPQHPGPIDDYLYDIPAEPTQWG